MINRSHKPRCVAFDFGVMVLMRWVVQKVSGSQRVGHPRLSLRSRVPFAEINGRKVVRVPPLSFGHFPVKGATRSHRPVAYPARVASAPFAERKGRFYVVVDLRIRITPHVLMWQCTPNQNPAPTSNQVDHHVLASRVSMSVK